MNNFTIKQATPEDCPIILDFIKKIAEYEVLLDSVRCSEEEIYNSFFNLKAAHGLIAYEGSEPVGFAVYYYNFSTFKGRPGLYLEDIFINSDKRSKGYGKKLFEYVMQIAVDDNCGRMEWSCLDWNKPSIDFYLSLGAEPMDEWTVYRFDDKKLREYFQ